MTRQAWAIAQLILELYARDIPKRVPPPSYPPSLVSSQDGGPGAKLRWFHQWKAGDFIIADNLAVAHEANADTQQPPTQVGLRIMHRCTVAGKTVPQKLPEGQV